MSCRSHIITGYTKRRYSAENSKLGFKHIDGSHKETDMTEVTDIVMFVLLYVFNGPFKNISLISRR